MRRRDLAIACGLVLVAVYCGRRRWQENGDQAPAHDAAGTWTTHKIRRQIARCKCGATRSRLVTETQRHDRILRPPQWPITKHGEIRNDGPAQSCEACARPLWFRTVAGTTTDKKCDARCVNSKGPTCECSCGGKNHGAGFA